MLKLDVPLQLSPVFKPKIWGRRDLAPVYPDSWTTRRGKTVANRYPGINSNWKEPVGESWLTGDDAKFLNGPVAGRTLGEVTREYGTELTGSAAEGKEFPILSKFIFTSDWLSVQVHPDDNYAGAHEGFRGKCEMWYILETKPEAAFLLGLKPGTSKAALREQLRQGTVRESVQRFKPEPNEAIFVPPGSVHALGPGIILFEAEQNSDVTYRLDDFGRLGPDGKPRPLHIEKALDVTRADLPAYRALPKLTFREPFGARRYVLASRFFAVEEWRLQKTGLFHGSPERVEAFAILSGEGRVETGAGWLGYRPGEAWLIPPATAHYRLAPETDTVLLKFYVPNIEKDFLQPLADRKLSPDEIKKVIFD
ncbi:MAG TPA: type I phosphomannose isomerase catalytic subunit [Terriglobia bacterium]|nr:type I phosphomannose isomerase catalytic subunit [Terriglobia bacterium]